MRFAHSLTFACLASTAFVAVAIMPTHSLAADNKESIADLRKELQVQRGRIEVQQRALETQLRALEKSQQRLNKQIRDIDKLEKRLSKALETALPEEMEAIEQADSAVPDQVGTERRTEEMEKPQAVEVATLADEGGVLLSKGQLIIDPSLEYSRASTLRVAVEGFTIVPALNIGSFDISQIDRDTYSASLGLRYGLTNRLEISTRVPYVYRNDSTLSRPIGEGVGVERLTDVSGDGIGDLEFGANYQLTNGEGGWPFLVANFRVKSNTGTNPFEVNIDPDTGLQTELPTGSGFWALSPSITAIFPSDPVVFFGNLGYLYNMPNDFGGNTGEIDPGDSISFSFGMGLGINDRTSFNVGYGHSVVFETTQNGNTLPTSDVLQVGSLDLGFSYQVNDSQNLNFTVSAGLTDDAPDVRLVFRAPFSLNLHE